MKLKFALALLVSNIAAPSYAGVSLDEAQQLGQTLTEIGATKAGNEEGTIPSFEGGLRQAPPGFKPDSGFWVDPFAGEKPLFRITAQNMEQYSEKLSDGQKELLIKNPDYYMDVYPTHRTAYYPDDVRQATVRNATDCNIERDGLAVNTACRGGIPFPIPKTGNELMWNMQLRYNTGKFGAGAPSASFWVVDRNGGVTKGSTIDTVQEHPYFQTEIDSRDPQITYRTYSLTTSPARRAGELTGITDFVDPVAKPRRSWSYTPGQRRVKLAPEFNYDTPIANMGGIELFDELFMFSGAQDRFDFKLVGKKEMFIPYNSYKFYFDCKEQLQKAHVNPSCERWELHRVWVVEANLKPGKRHVYSKRKYYLDEDTYGAGMYDAWDQSGDLYRAMMMGGVQLYDKDIHYVVKHSIYDFNKGMYGVINDGMVGGFKVLDKAFSDREMNPEAIVTRMTQR